MKLNGAILVLILDIIITISGCGTGTTTTTSLTMTPGQTFTPPPDTGIPLPTTAEIDITVNIKEPTTSPTIEPTQTSETATNTPVPATTTPTQEPEQTTIPPTSPEPTDYTFVLTSSAFPYGGEMPDTYARGGDNLSPDFLWTGAPEGTASFIIIFDDEDANNFCHWIVYNIPGHTEYMSEGVPKDYQSTDGSVMQGRNDFGLSGYDGPSPPSGVHTYFFRLFALDTTLNFASLPDRAQVLAAMEGHILAFTDYMGTYSAS